MRIKTFLPKNVKKKRKKKENFLLAYVTFFLQHLAEGPEACTLLFSPTDKLSEPNSDTVTYFLATKKENLPNIKKSQENERKTNHTSCDFYAESICRSISLRLLTDIYLIPLAAGYVLAVIIPKLFIEDVISVLFTHFATFRVDVFKALQ